MAKDVASVASPVAITVKKSTADRPCKVTAEGKTITLAMDAKLTAGDYTVTVKGMESEDLTATVNVAKNETLTSYYISENLVASVIGVSSRASFRYAALNQYGEKMVAGTPSATCSFGDIETIDAASATKDGTVYVKNISNILSIVGTTGTATLVDQSGTGVNKTQSLTFSDVASAKEVTYEGVYNKNTAKIVTLKENDKLADYELLFKVKDQYGYDLEASDLVTSGTNRNTTVTLAGGLTKLELPASYAFIDRTVDGVDYVALQLKGGDKAKAGDATLTIVNSYKGMLLSQVVTVAKDVVVKSVNFTFDNGLYAGEDNEIGYDIIDSEGNNVTSYADLLNAIDSTSYSTQGNLTLKMERKKDGTAKFILNVAAGAVANGTLTDTNSIPGSFTTYWNKNTSNDYLVQTTSCTLSQARYAKSVSGIASNATISFPANSGAKSFTIGSDKLLLADQYGNQIKDGDTLFNSVISNGAVRGTAGTSIKIVTNGAFEAAVTGNNKIVVTPGAVAGSGTVYMSFCTGNASADVRTGEGKTYANATTSKYDAKFIINVYGTEDASVDTYKLTVNDGYSVSTSAATNANIQYKVTAKIGGEDVEIPASQCTIVDNKNNDFSAEDNQKDVKTKTATLKVQVTTWDKAGNTISTVVSSDYTLSRDDAKVYKVDGVVGDTDLGTVTSNVTAGAFVTQFKFKDQYGHGATTASAINGDSITVATDTGCGNTTSWKTGDLKYRVELVSGPESGNYVGNNETGNVYIDYSKLASGSYVFKVTAWATDKTEKSVKISFTK